MSLPSTYRNYPRAARPRTLSRWLRAVSREVAVLDEGTEDVSPTPQGCVAMVVCAVIGPGLMWGFCWVVGFALR